MEEEQNLQSGSSSPISRFSDSSTISADDFQRHSTSANARGSAIIPRKPLPSHSAARYSLLSSTKPMDAHADEQTQRQEAPSAQQDQSRDQDHDHVSRNHSFIKLAPVRPSIARLNLNFINEAEIEAGPRHENSLDPGYDRRQRFEDAQGQAQTPTDEHAGDSSPGVESTRKLILAKLKKGKDPDTSRLWRYLQVIASFILYMSSWGLLNSFGVFQDYYLQHFLSQESPSRVAWIGSLQGFLLMFVGALVGPLLDMGYMHHVIVVGIVLTTIGMVCTAFCNQYYQFILAQGVTVGIGAGCCFYPSITVPPQWYGPQHRTIALGIVSTGSSIGGVIFPVIFEYVQMSGGFRWAVLTIALLLLVVDVFAVFVIRLKTLPSSPRAILALEMFQERDYKILCLIFFLGFIGLYIPVFFVQSYASEIPSFPSSLVIWMIPILMAASGVGRVVPNIIAEQMGNVNTFLPVIVGLVILSFSWIGVKSSAGGLVVFALIYGFFCGGFVSLVPPVIVSTAPNMQKLGTRIGMALTCGSFGVLIGNPVAGAILGDTHQYLGLQIFGGSCLLLAAAFCFILRRLKSAKILVKV